MTDNRPLTVVQISDQHLDPDDAASMARFEAVRAKLVELRPDWIVASGDLTADAFLKPGMFQRVKAEFDRCPAPVLAIPGNHDIGNKLAGGHMVITPESLAMWDETFGSSRFSVSSRGWQLIGINTQIVGSRLPLEQEQLDWLDRELAEAGRAGRSVALFMHEAPYLLHPDEHYGDSSDYWSFPLDQRQHYLRRFHGGNVRLLAHGHVHWHHSVQRNGTMYVWCPSTTIAVNDPKFPRGGEVLGMVRYELGPQGVKHEVVPVPLPPALRLQTLQFDPSKPVF